ncbi:MAG: hydroxymyristoyl-ACP dehydratase [Chitinophagaceae bacterium]
MHEEIIELLPYKSSFKFVDHISALSTEGITAEYTLKKDAFFYEDHFVNNPVTPGAIITEIMAQCGLVAFGIYLLKDEHKIQENNYFPLLTSVDISFLKMVLPGEKVVIISKKIYFRFNKLKCFVEMQNQHGETIAKGNFSGIIQQADLKKLQG